MYVYGRLKIPNTTFCYTQFPIEQQETTCRKVVVEEAAKTTLGMAGRVWIQIMLKEKD